MTDDETIVTVEIPNELHSAVSEVANRTNGTVPWLLRGCLMDGFEEFLEWSEEDFQDLEVGELPCDNVGKWASSETIELELPIRNTLYDTLVRIANRTNHPNPWLMHGCIADGYGTFVEWTDEDFEDLGVEDIPCMIQRTNSEMSTMACPFCNRTLTNAGMDFGPWMTGYCYDHGLVGVNYI